MSKGKKYSAVPRTTACHMTAKGPWTFNAQQ
jgi:hypothetical protein